VLISVSLCLIAILLPGCVSVREPLSDPDKAEPDKRLLGKWQDGAARCEIDSPAVKGSPKGLMRAVSKGHPDNPPGVLWFFTTTIGKQTYATIYLEANADKDLPQFADFRNEGAFEKWNKGNDRRYFIVRYVLDGDNLTVDLGDKEAVAKVMQAEKIVGDGFFKTPPAWLATYLEKNGSQTLYKGTAVEVWRRVR
jgi:hypothetical protein